MKGNICSKSSRKSTITKLTILALSLTAATNENTSKICNAYGVQEQIQNNIRTIHIDDQLDDFEQPMIGPQHESMKQKITRIREDIGQSVMSNLTKEQQYQQNWPEEAEFLNQQESVDNGDLNQLAIIEEEGLQQQEHEDDQSELSYVQKKLNANIDRKSRKKAKLGFIPRPRQGPDEEPTPTVIFHGIRQVCTEVLLTNLVEQVHQGTKGHVECIEIGNGDITSLFASMNNQASEACNKIKAHPIFGQRQFNILGLSQGSLIGRFIVESCDTKYTVRNLVTVGAPNNGFDFEENCNEPLDQTRCEIQNKIKAFPLISPYSSLIQSTIGPASYLKDHTKIDEYYEKASFLPYLNNERDHFGANKNKKRFENLNFLTMIKFEHDPIIYPRESSWFGEMNSEGNVIPMEETKIFKENTFGLRTLSDEGRIEKKEIDGVHLQFRNDHIEEIFVPPLLK